MTALFNDIIFGPVRSRRLGLSLGVNLLPTHSKLCNFDCIYCECGWNADNRGSGRFNERKDVVGQLEATLADMSRSRELPDVITFAGNGEPTLHPEFELIINDTLALRDEYAPKAKVSVLTNATMLHREDVVRALKRVDNNILKIDSAIDSTARIMNNPSSPTYSVERVAAQIKSFEGGQIVQTMFLRGEYNGVVIDNTTPREVDAWVNMIERISPRMVMLYSIDRNTPCSTLCKVDKSELMAISAKIEALGIETSIA